MVNGWNRSEHAEVYAMMCITWMYYHYLFGWSMVVLFAYLWNWVRKNWPTISPDTILSIDHWSSHRKYVLNDNPSQKNIHFWETKWQHNTSKLTQNSNCIKWPQSGSKMSDLEVYVVADQDVSLHEVPLIGPVLCHHREGVVGCGAQDAHQRLDTCVRIHICQVGLHDITGRQPISREKDRDE